MPTAADIAADLFAEHDALELVVASLEQSAWDAPTPSPGWTVADQISHLTFFDNAAALALSDPDGFVAHRDALVAEAFESPEAFDRLTLRSRSGLTGRELLEEWRSARQLLADACASVDGERRIEWYGPSMSPRSFLTARLMETWAHGQDIVDAVGATREPTDRLRHIAQLGVITRTWSYLNRGEDVPVGEVDVILRGPSGDVWSWGSGSAEATITGPALDFVMVTTQRRHAADTDLILKGDLAVDWMAKAQAFAGGPTQGPPPTSS